MTHAVALDGNLHAPVARAVSVSTPRTTVAPRWPALAVLAIPLFCVALLTKFAVPPLGAQGIGISVMVIPLAIAAGIFAGCMRVDPVRLAFFLLVAGGLGVVPLFRGAPFSVNSVVLFAAVHVPLVFAVAAERDGARWAVSLFLNLAFGLACLGIVQFCLQFFVAARFAFPIENFVPASFVVEHFNQQGPLGYGTDLFRSNGVFLVEPSYFAQLLAIAIVVELSTANRLRRLPVYGLALLLAHSGTGLMILAVCLPLLVLGRRRWDLLLAGVVISGVLFLLREHLFLDRLLLRVGEFESTETSGFARFVGGFYLFDQFLWSDPLRTLFGAGPGTFLQFAVLADYTVAEMPLFKTVFEFGLIGTLAYFGFIGYCFFSTPAPRLVGIAILLCLLLNGLYVPFAHALALALLVWPYAAEYPPTEAPERAAPGRPPASEARDTAADTNPHRLGTFL